MKIDWLKPLVGRPGPFATVYLDATPSAVAGDKDVANRWRAARRALEQQGAPGGVLDELEDAVRRPTREGGAHGRVLIADGEGVLVDRVLRNPPATASAVWLPVPALLQAALAADEAVDALCVAVDRGGADFWCCDSGGRATGARETYTAPHDEVSKASSTGTGRATIESRAEDTWERNAAAVVAEIDRRVAGSRPEILLLTGDVRTVKAVRSALGQDAARRAVEVPGGGRGAGVHAAAFSAAVEDALDSYRERRRELALAEFRQDQGREEGAVTSVDDVVAVLARGQVKELVLSEQLAADAGAALAQASAGPADTSRIDGILGGRRLWIGPDPMHVATSRGDLEDLGVAAGLEELPASSALLRAAIAQDAGLTFAPEGSVELVDGVGATLRWHDGSTPREVAATMSGDGDRFTTPR
ncbi:Vms1/Ankzf1 family peptidyl-tRNA hydrolase [Isoptericola hypogeus]|uniref:Vms1/Ankzf1 family peptidyl-tRNA hydrolase n=1 Tax=Isoptericola hypogeus TaxID=300179 RepID=A0ABN2JH51_9MICO